MLGKVWKKKHQMLMISGWEAVWFFLTLLYILIFFLALKVYYFYNKKK